MNKMKFQKIIWSAAFLICSSFSALAACNIEQQKGGMAWDNFQTKDNVTAGSANTTATLNITYQ
ncbi:MULTISPECIES: hypothetical protein [Citrobacter]|uniref:hypothetical protein n=1 Tax=Citrobacter TaxID=544 RepID=UPI0006A9AC00|nr:MULTISPECIES: hypothetical protein [Citrobacter]QLY01881.1 hypothetical protein HV243_05095 [Citrobacter sp. RHBSTW-00599]TCC76931.1 hypothetical protein EY919_08635 [Citrobacter braakii]WFY32341.1 hypothetical protein NFK28_05615 [Citrobacter braakii]